jgi:hypothetical protein
MYDCTIHLPGRDSEPNPDTGAIVVGDNEEFRNILHCAFKVEETNVQWSHVAGATCAVSGNQAHILPSRDSSAMSNS